MTEFISDVYLKELTIPEITESIFVTLYLDLLLVRKEMENFPAKLYNKCNAAARKSLLLFEFTYLFKTVKTRAGSG